jgi:hypothetical protein
MKVKRPKMQFSLLNTETKIMGLELKESKL